ncbi:MAG: 3-isopropylmalate dehydratase small subunit [Thermodesulfobacteriota bacterium]
MPTIITGKAFVFGANVDTDQIYPGRYLELTDFQEVAAHAMEGIDPNFRNEFQAGDIIVAATNFGCGSSREHAAIALKAIGVGAIIASSFGRIFYRNAINLGLPLIVCPEIHRSVDKGDLLEIDFSTGRILNKTKGLTLQGQPLSPYVLKILAAGGIKPLIKMEYGQ